VENSEFFANNVARELPCFSSRDIKLGQELGMGEFGKVSEVLSIRSTTKHNVSNSASTTPRISSSSSIPEHPRYSSTNSPNSGNLISHRHDESFFLETETGPLTDAGTVGSLESMDSHDDIINLDAASAFMAEECIRDGIPRYAIKKIRDDLDDEIKASGIGDLAIEARFLSVLNHPNIIRMRATSTAEPISIDYFLVLDRLPFTLEQKINEWRELKKEWSSKSLLKGIFQNKRATLEKRRCREEKKQLYADRVLAVYDISRAMRYIHSHNIIYRDLKPDNIGFDVRGNVKIFDFGLAKELSPKKYKMDKSGNYDLTGLTGSRRYMAPEVLFCNPYNLKADVYSFSILTWEVLSLSHAFDGYSCEKHARNVGKNGERPKVSATWQISVGHIITEGWDAKSKKRPSFDRICSIFSGAVGTLLGEDGTLLMRSDHLLDLSNKSCREITARKSKADSRKGGGSMRGRFRSYSSNASGDGDVSRNRRKM